MNAINGSNNANNSDSDEECIRMIIAACDTSSSSFYDSSSTTSSSSSSDDEQQQHPTVTNFVETIDEFGEKDFKSHMRLRKDTVEFLINRFENEVLLLTNRKGGKRQINAKTTVYMYLWYISNTVTYRQLAVLFGVSKFTAWRVVRRFVVWIISISHEFIKWPTGSALHDTCRKFKEKRGIPGVVGAIDCTHITINAPKTHKESYFDRKKNYSVVLQAIVDADKKFIDLYCGEPGSMHDSRVLRRSKFYSIVSENPTNLLPDNTFVIGDSAYKCSNWLVTPFKDVGRLTEQQKKFNFLHSSTRMVVENAFGLLKERFRRLNKFTEHRELSAVTNLIVSACVLHNVCIIKEGAEGGLEEPVQNVPNEEPMDDINENQQTTTRDILFNYLIQENII